MKKAKKPKFYGWKCPRCGMLTMSRKPHFFPEEYEAYEKDIRSGLNVMVGDPEICHHCYTPMIPRKRWME